MKISTEPPKPYIAVALLPIDDNTWADDLYQCPLREDEFEALRHIPGIVLQNYQVPVAMIGEFSEEDAPKPKKQRK